MKTRLWTKDYILTILAMMCCHMGPYLLLSVISVFAKNLTGSDAYAGMMTSVFALSGLFARFASAYLLDKMSIKKVMLLTMTIFAIASFGYIFVDSFWMAFLLRGVQGFGYGIAITSMSTYIVGIIPTNRLLEGIGYSSLTNSLGGVIGPTLAFAILGQYYDRFQLLFMTVFAFAISTLVLLFMFKDIDMTAQNEEEIVETQQQMKWVFVLVPFAIQLLTSFASSSISSFLSLYAISLGFEGIGAYFSINAIGLFFSRFTMKKIVDRLGNFKAILLCTILNVGCIYGISCIKEVWQLYLIAFPFGFSMGAMSPIVNTLMIENMPKSKSGLANAIFYGAGDLGFIVGPTFWGYVAGISSYSSMFMFSAIFCCSAILLSIYQMKLLKQ